MTLDEKIITMQQVIDTLQKRLDQHINGTAKMPEDIAGAYSGKIEGISVAIDILKNDDPGRIF